jgi:hypothetical protein
MADHTYTIALDPELGISPTDLVNAWNTDPNASAAAEAHIIPASQVDYDPFSVGVLAVLGSVAVGLATNALYDLLKAAVQRSLQARQQPTRIETTVRLLEQPDGTRVLIVSRREEC